MFLLVAHLKMVRFLKKNFWKRSPKPVPEDAQAHKPTNVDTGRDTDPEGEYRLREIAEPIRRMELIQSSHQVPTKEEALGSQTKTEGPIINSLPPRFPRLRLPTTMVATKVSVVGQRYLNRCLSTVLKAPQGLGVQQPPATAAEDASGDGQDGLDAYGLVRSEKSGGERQGSSHSAVRTDRYQPRREAGLIGPSGASHLWSTSPGGRPERSLPSRQSWNQSPSSARNIRYVLMLCSSPFSDNSIYRTRSPLRTRSKYFSRASLLWRSFSSSLQMTRGNRSVAKEYQCIQSVSVQSRY